MISQIKINLIQNLKIFRYVQDDAYSFFSIKINRNMVRSQTHGLESQTRSSLAKIN